MSILVSRRMTPPGFFVSNSGNDGNSGLSTLLPWQTYGHALTTAPAGARINGRGGDLFRETATLNNPYTLAAYGTGQPIISGSSVISGWGAAGVGTNTWSVAMATQTNIVWNNNVLAALGASNSTLTNGQWFWGTNLLYFRWDAGNPDAQGLAIEAGQRKNVAVFGVACTLQNTTFQRSNDASQALNISNSNPAAIQWCTVKDGAGIGIHVQGGTTNNFSINNNVISGHQRDGITTESAATQTAAYIGYNTITGNGLLNNVNGFAGIGYQGLEGAIIEHNTITAGGPNGPFGFCHGIYIGTAVLSTPAVVRYNNCSNHTNGSGIRLHGNATVTGNVCSTNGEDGFELASHTGSDSNTYTLIGNVSNNNGRAGFADFAVGQTGGTTINMYQNTVDSNTQHGIHFDAALGGTCALDCRDNILVAGAATNAFDLGTIPSPATIDYNCSWRPDASTSIYRWGAATFPTFAQWQGTYGNDVHGINANPLFTNVGAGDYTLQAGSPCIGTALVIPGVTTGTPPNMGAL